MKWPRLSIGAAMALVGAVALTCAGFRVFASHGPTIPNADRLLVGLPPIVFLLQVGLYRAALRRGRARAFWAGFVAFGLLSAGTWVAAIVGLPDSMETPLVVWGAFLELAVGGLMLALPPWVLSQHPLVWWAAAAGLLFLPHLVLSCVGGLLTRSLVGFTPGCRWPSSTSAEFQHKNTG